VKRGRGVKMMRVGLVKVPVETAPGVELAAAVMRDCGRGVRRCGIPASGFFVFVQLQNGQAGERVVCCDAELLEPLHAAIGRLLGVVGA
jgi:hypothetical protein